jgi:hypothetical protein
VHIQVHVIVTLFSKTQEVSSRTTKTNAGKDVRENVSTYTAGGNVSLYNHFGK